MDQQPLTVWETIKKSIGIGIIAMLGGVGGGATNYVANHPSSEKANASPIYIQQGALSKTEYYKDRVSDKQMFFDMFSEIRDRLTRIEEENKHNHITK